MKAPFEGISWVSNKTAIPQSHVQCLPIKSYSIDAYEMSEQLPPLIYVDLVEVDGVTRHCYEGLLRHLEQQLDPTIRENILFFYLTGSRLYGTSTEESDWDYMCVTKRTTRPARKSKACLRNGDDSISSAKPLMVDTSNVYDMDATLEAYGLPTDKVPTGLRFDVSFYPLETWKRMAFEHSIIALEAQFLPPAYILYKEKDFPNFVIDPPVLKTTASLLGGLKFANSRQRLFEGNFAKAKRLGALGIRYLQFGIQLLESYRDSHGKPNITDWHAIKPVWEDLFAKHDPKNYDEFEAIFRPTFKSYDTHLRQIMIYPTLYTAREMFSTRWNAIRPTLVKLKSISFLSSEQPFIEPKGFSKNASALLERISRNTDSFALEAVGKLHLMFSISKCSSLLSLSLTAHADTYSNPALAELNGAIISLPDWRVISPPNISTPVIDLVHLAPLISNEIVHHPSEAQNQLISHLSTSEEIEIFELYDSLRIAAFYFNGEWRTSCLGGSVDASEKIAMRTTEGRGPSRRTASEEFLRLFAQTTSFSGKPAISALDQLSKDRIYIFDMLSDCIRAITANSPERLIFQFSLPLLTGDSVGDECSILNTFHRAKQFGEVESRLKSIGDWKDRVKNLFEEVELMNPFEQAGFEIRSKSTCKSIKLSCRSYWSVKASVGHQNRVLAFNVGADHFEPECLLDVCIFGFNHEFVNNFPSWANAVSISSQKLEKICQLIVDQSKQCFFEKDRKKFAALVAPMPGIFKTIMFEWSNMEFVSVKDIVSTLDISNVRVFGEMLAEKESSGSCT